MAEIKAAVVGVSGPSLTAEEAALLRRHRPLGAILFRRNVVDPMQVAALNAALREELGADAPILVDQEGGRVARLRPPHWTEFPPPSVFEAGPDSAAEANAALLGAECAATGLDVVCAPLLDLRLPGAHQVIGDRAFSADPAEVARLGAAWIRGLQAAGCIPVIKHIPGHGRALVDSHLDLPRVAVGLDELALDCAPFAALADAGAWAMTAHILYAALDAERPATLSPVVIEQVIRGAIGFDGLLMTDDLSMKALSGDFTARTKAALAAGCDIVLHCNGDMAEMQGVARGVRLLTGKSRRRADAALARIARVPEPFDVEEGRARLDAAFEGRFAA
jgi:beta-N-acetylhexosaminidase